LRRFVNERGKIIPRRITGNCARHQRKTTRAVKRARIMAIMAFESESFR
jgi:small subunit ribosomal protein S18